MQVQLTGNAELGRKVIPIMPITPYSVKGKYRNLKTSILGIAFFVYFAMPWLVWNGDKRVGQPILLDIAHSRFHLFDIALYPQDLMLLLGLLVFAAAFLFISATMFGRIFCGFFCFQTIWTDAFRFIEKCVQGEAQARKRLRKQPWGLEKAWKLGATHALWLLLALATAVTFTLYFADARQLIVDIPYGNAPWAAYVTIAVLTSTTYVAAGIAREEICRVACPYGKFQSVVQDGNTKTVIYDQGRGERTLGRAQPDKILKDATARAALGYGDCVDCGYCVNVCPTGVDIRKGFQIDCISCGLCIDACDTVMKKLNLATGLIRFDKAASGSTAAKVPAGATVRKWAYLSLLLACMAFMGYKLAHLEPFSASVQQQAQPLSTILSNGDVKTRYILRITNKEQAPQQYRVQIQGLQMKSANASEYTVPAGKTHTFTMDVVMDAATGRASHNFIMHVTPASQPDAAQDFKLSYIPG